MLSIDQIASYHRDGFLAIRDFATPEACRTLRRRADEILRSFDAPGPVAATPGRAADGEPRLADGAAGIRRFLDGEGLGPGGEPVPGTAPGATTIGHAMHDLDPVFEAFSYTPQLAAVAADVGLTDPLVLQSTYTVQQPHVGRQVRCAQDAQLLYTDPVSVTGFWFAIEDATLENGCLWAQPGGHRGPLRRRYERASDGEPGATRVVELDDTPMPDAPPGVLGPPGAAPPPPTPMPDPPKGLVPIVAPAGTLVVLHGLLPHWSDVNRTAVGRHAYSLHCIAAAADYPATNLLQRPPELPLRRLDLRAARGVVRA